MPINVAARRTAPSALRACPQATPNPDSRIWPLRRFLCRHLRFWRVCASLAILIVTSFLASPGALWAQDAGADALDPGPTLAFVPWYALAAALALFVTVGWLFIGVAGLHRQAAWRTGLSALAAVSLAAVVYWAIGFALQFGGVGLVYPQAELQALVWEWSPLSVNWGSGWGAAGLSGWLVSASDLSWAAYALFLAHLPWMMAATALIVMALYGRTPFIAAACIALSLGGVILPLAGNWIQGGGWLNALGRNLNLGHGFIDFGGAGSIYLTATAFGLSALLIWGRGLPHSHNAVHGGAGDDGAGSEKAQLPSSHWPLLAVFGAFCLLIGSVGWIWANPLHNLVLAEHNLLRSVVNVWLGATAGALVPLVYTWFVAGESHAVISARGLAAGMVAALASGPFVSPTMAVLIGFLAGATVPFSTYIVDRRLRLNDATGLVSACGLPAIIGLLLVGLLADGSAGAGWQLIGATSYLGVTGQGVSGLWVAAGFQPDFPGQLQAQLIGVMALLLWGSVTGILINYPLALIAQGLHQSESRRVQPPNAPISSPRPQTPTLRKASNPSESQQKP